MKNNHQIADYLVILYIDNGLPFDYEPWTGAEEFKKRGITLFVIVHRTPNYDVWNDLRTLAENTGWISIIFIHIIRNFFVYRWCLCL